MTTHGRPVDADETHDEATVLAVDIGGTTVKGAVLDRAGSVVARRAAPTFAVPGNAFASVAALVAQLHEAAAARGRRPVGIGLASPGLVDAAAGVVTYAANLGWSGMPLRDRLQDRFGLPVALEHDARAGALAERATHPEDTAGYTDFVFVPIGTGVSAAVVSGGVLVRGGSGAAGELGHVPVVPGGEPCACGQRGCVEAYASARSVVERYRRRGGRSATSAPELVACLEVDTVARQVWGEAVDALALGVAGLTAVLDPTTVVVGGGLSSAGDALLDPLERRLRDQLTWRAPPRLVRSVLGPRAGLVGTALLAWAGRPTALGFPRTAARELAGDVPSSARP